MDFQLPQLGEGIYEAELVRWMVAPGDTIYHGQGLMEVLTDKATMEVPSPFAGKIDSLNAKSGDTIKVGQHILSYQTSNAPAPVPVTSGVGPSPRERERPSPTRSASPAIETRGTNGAHVIKASPSVRHL